MGGCHPSVHVLSVLVEVREAAAEGQVEAVILGFCSAKSGFLPCLGSVLRKARSVARGMLEDCDRVQSSPSSALDRLNILHDDLTS